MDDKKNSLKIKKLLWSVDFSKNCLACLPYIQAFNEKMHIANHGIYVLPRFADWVYETAFFKDEEFLETIDKARDNSLKQLETVCQKTGLKFEAAVHDGLASDEIIAYAGKHKIDMIVAGRRGESEIEEIQIGSTTSRLIRNSHVPVLVVPHAHPHAKKEFKIENILSPIDLSESSLLELRYSISLAKQLQAKLYVIHVAEFFNYKVPIFKRDMLLEKINERIAEIATELDYSIEEIIHETGEPAQRIIQVAKKRKIDLIPMATHQRKGIEKFFLGSISEKVLMTSNVPILIIPPAHYEQQE